MKATSVVVDSERRSIFKDPITDDGTKKSAKGLLSVVLDEGEYVLKNDVSEMEEHTGELKTIYRDGEFVRSVTLDFVRERINHIL
jgi:nicotinamide phosphoribosyltransferase